MHIEAVMRDRSRTFEDTYGIASISRTIDERLRKNESLTFIDALRENIRGNEWFYDDSVRTTFDDLVQRWERTHLTYIDVAEQIYRKLAGIEDRGLTELHGLVLKAETLRARDGKRSRIGLDHMLDSYIHSLEKLSERYGFEDEETEILISVIRTPRLSAEHELFEDFHAYVTAGGESIDPQSIERMDERTGGLATKILREYCKYSTKDFNRKFELIDVSEDVRARKEDSRALVQNERRVVAEKMLASFEGLDKHRFVRLTERIDNLNFLNANIEVKYSFKGWPGLLHYFVLDGVKQTHAIEDVYRRHGKLMVTEGV